jgi:hypothetical protein
MRGQQRVVDRDERILDFHALLAWEVVVLYIPQETSVFAWPDALKYIANNPDPRKVGTGSRKVLLPGRSYTHRSARLPPGLRAWESALAV